MDASTKAGGTDAPKIVTAPGGGGDVGAAVARVERALRLAGLASVLEAARGQGADGIRAAILDRARAGRPREQVSG